MVYQGSAVQDLLEGQGLFIVALLKSESQKLDVFSCTYDSMASRMLTPAHSLPHSQSTAGRGGDANFWDQIRVSSSLSVVRRRWRRAMVCCCAQCPKINRGQAMECRAGWRQQSA